MGDIVYVGVLYFISLVGNVYLCGSIMADWKHRKGERHVSSVLVGSKGKFEPWTLKGRFWSSQNFFSQQQFNVARSVINLSFANWNRSNIVYHICNKTCINRIKIHR